MEILLWLVPPVVVSLLAMAWVAWLGREGRGEVDREEAARRIGAALEREPRIRRGRAAPQPEPAGDRSSGVAVRRPTEPHPTPSREPAATPETTPHATPRPATETPRRLAS